MKYILLSFILIFSLVINAQNVFVGTYEGVFNGDNISLSLTSNGANYVVGNMQDSQNKYDVSGTITNNTFSGQAIEPKLGLQFAMSGTLQSNVFNAVLSFDFLGEKHDMNVVFNKTKKTNQTETTNKTVTIPNKPRDGNVVGTWVKESNYSSGYSSNGSYGAMNTRESMVFYADGSMGDGGSSTVVGGSNFSGSSSGAGTGVVQGLYWWTENSKIYLHITEGGKSQQLELGRYYVENGRMLITGANGEKILLTKQ